MGNYHPLTREQKRQMKDQEVEEDTVFHRWMLHRINDHWIPIIEREEVAKGRKAYWNSERSIIMFRE